MILLIDNYDSFSYNLVQLIGSLAKDTYIKVIRNDELTVKEIEELKPSHIILSPGPGRPKDAGVLEKVVISLKGVVPILGVCLGHQGICEAFGATITYASTLMHGKQSLVALNQDRIFQGLGANILVGRYHSLAVKADTLPEELKLIGTAQDGDIMAVKHRDYEIYGVQFHPESVLTPNGSIIMENFLKL
jgi:anthranilate synthase component II